MSALTIRRHLRRRRRHLAVIVAALVLAGAIAVHHGGTPSQMHHDSGVVAALEMCLGVFTAVGVALAAAGLAVLVRRRPQLVRRVAATAARVLLVPPARARHGPAAISVLCVNRR